MRLPDGRWYPTLTPTKGVEIFNATEKFLLVDGPRRCAAPGTMVWTPDGTKPIELLEVGDEVLAFSDGGSVVSCRVVGAWWRDSRDAIRLTSEAGHDVTVSSNHPVWCCVETPFGPSVRWVEAGEIQRRIAVGQKIWSPVVKPKEIAQPDKRIDPKNIETWFFGALTGDGSTYINDDKGRSRSITFTKGDLDVVRLVKRACFELSADVVQFGPIDYRIINCNGLRQRIMDGGGLNCTSDYKRIPGWIMSGGLDVIASYLMGLFDTDGCAEKNGCISWTSKSEGLARDVATCLLRLGIFCTRKIFKARCTNAKQPHEDTYHGINIYGDDAVEFARVVGFACSRKRDRIRDVITGKGRTMYGFPSCLKEHVKRLKRAKFKGKRGGEKFATRAWHRSNKWLYKSTKYSPSRADMDRLVGFFQDRTLDRLSASDRWVRWESAECVDSALRDIEVESSHSYISDGVPHHNCGKTLSILHRLCRIAWECPESVIAVVCKTLKNAEIGVWRDLVGSVVKEWCESGIGFSVTVEPRLNSASKMPYFKVRSHDGRESEFQLHSCERPEEAEEKFKGARFSHIYISEADQIISPSNPDRDRDLFNILSQQLRSLTVPPERWQLIADCNPPANCRKHWIARVWFPHTDQTEEPKKNPTYSALFRRIQVPLDSNTLLPEAEKLELYAMFEYDPDLFDRMVLGKWVDDVRETHFADVFGPSNVIGTIDVADKADWKIIKPGPEAISFFTGWDLGDVNHAVCFFYGWLGPDNLFHYGQFDEIELVGRRVSIESVTKRAMDKMDYWERHMQSKHGRFPIHWRHWSDTSAFVRYRAAGNTYDAVLVRQASGGRILLQPVTKGPGSVKNRLLLSRRLLGERRVWQSAYCPHSNTMLRELKKGDEYDPILSDDPCRHLFDAWSYALTMECPIQQAPKAPRATSGLMVEQTRVIR